MHKHKRQESDMNTRAFNSFLCNVQTALDVSIDSQVLSNILSRFDEEIKLRTLVDARVLLVAFEGNQLASLRDYMRTAGIQVSAATPNVEHLSINDVIGPEFTHILVNIDAFDDLEAAVDALSAFRRRFCHVVILCSAHVAHDDLGNERSVICDASLRLPVSSRRLLQGLVTASANRSERLGF